MILVRHAVPPDLPHLIDIARTSATAAHWNHDEYAKLVAPEMVHERVTLVIEQDGEVAGFIVGRSLAEEWEIENIAIRGPARRRGLGSHLLGEFLNLARNRGGKQVFLEVRESNQVARSLYEKWAFIECGRRKSYYQDPAENAVILKFCFPQEPANLG
jgi:ribosomal-protein-alanine N-acetyltransferase